jgi:ribosomal protein S27E
MGRKKFNLKSDKFRKAKGGRSRILELHCARCGAHLMLYQKDGLGRLKRCYLDRIQSQPPDTQYHVDPSTRRVSCVRCKTLLGILIEHTSGRAAYRLVPGAINKRIP